jgi:hypothetical protein
MLFGCTVHVKQAITVSGHTNQIGRDRLLGETGQFANGHRHI